MKTFTVKMQRVMQHILVVKANTQQEAEWKAGVKLIDLTENEFFIWETVSAKETPGAIETKEESDE